MEAWARTTTSFSRLSLATASPTSWSCRALSPAKTALKASSTSAMETFIFFPAWAAWDSIKLRLASWVVFTVQTTPILLPRETALAAMGSSILRIGTSSKGRTRSTAGEVEEQVKRITPAPASRAEKAWPAARRTMAGVRPPAAKRSLSRLSSTRLKNSRPG